MHIMVKAEEDVGRCAYSVILLNFRERIERGRCFWTQGWTWGEQLWYTGGLFKGHQEG